MEPSRSTRSPDIERIMSLAKDQEILISVPAASNGSIKFSLLDGGADVLGVKLQERKEYSYGPGSTLSILARGEGCTISFAKGQRFILKTVNATTETTDKMLRNIGAQLEDLRCIAESENGVGPIVCLAGPTDSGKSTACVALLNYAVQKSRKPFYVDLDLGQGKLSIPGTFGAVVADSSIDITGDFSHLRKHAINYFVGSKSPGDLLASHNLIVSAFVQSIRRKMEKHRKVKYSGMVINSCGWVEGPGYKILKHIIEAFQADHVLVLGTEPPNLSRKLREDFSDRNIGEIPRSLLIAQKSFSYRKEARARRVHEYFCGNASTSLDELVPDISEVTKSDSFEVQLSDVQIYKISQGRTVTESSVVSPVIPSRDLVNQLLGISKSDVVGENQLEALNISGYVYALKINQIRGTLTLVGPPNQGVFTHAVLLLSDIPLIEKRKK